MCIRFTLLSFSACCGLRNSFCFVLKNKMYFSLLQLFLFLFLFDVRCCRICHQGQICKKVDLCLNRCLCVIKYSLSLSFFLPPPPPPPPTTISPSLLVAHSFCAPMRVSLFACRVVSACGEYNIRTISINNGQSFVDLVKRGVLMHPCRSYECVFGSV